VLMSTREPAVCNAMTVDVEDYFQVSAFEQHIPRSRWELLPCRIEQNMARILALFDEAGIKATFFILGWVAERYPALVRRVAESGHEVASHGYAHIRVGCQSPADFHADVARTRALLEDTCGEPVSGYRAASYSIDRRTLWALEELRAAGYRYSSSIYPIRHDLYGMPGAPRFPFHHPADGGLLEIPVTTVRLGRQTLPCGGGGYFRLFPYVWSRWAIRRVNRGEGRAAVFYFHPWEIDPRQPRQRGIGMKSHFRHYLNLSRMESRLQRLLADFSWGRMDRVFLDQLE